MREYLAIVTAEHAYLRAGAEGESGENTTGITDEIFSGWAVRVFEEASGKEYVRVETHYGYEGFVKKGELREISAGELLQRQDKDRFFRIGISEADLLETPKVQGLFRELLLKNSLVELLERDVVPGWSRVRSAAGREGYVHTVYLRPRKEDDGYLLQEQQGDKGYFQTLKDKIAGEEEFREKLARSAKEYLGTQYRWGGKSAQGLDCSGLVFMSYLDNGLLIYRDAQIQEGYPVHEISREQLKKGDLIFFPGHVAMYLGDGKFIHSTGYEKTPYVLINSLRAEDPDYRQDLAEKIIHCGSVFA